MENTIRALVAALSPAKHFEEAAHAALRALLQLAVDQLFRSRFAAPSSKILRGTVHLRPADGYRRLMTVEALALDKPKVAGDDDFLPEMLSSATAWRVIVENGAPVAIDVNTGRVSVHREGTLTVLEEHGKGGAFDATVSARRLLARNTSHLFVVPLLEPAGAVVGMLALEASCRRAIGGDFIWPDCAADISLLTAIAGPYLAYLPLRPSNATPPDVLLPVIGPSMASCAKLLRSFAVQEETILLGGPTGAGKSRLARWCHAQSPRRGACFERLDLMTVPENLQVGELFGWKRGAFTGADQDTPGRLARAEGGTLFIDEIDKLTLRAQAALLEVLDERTYRPLGEKKSKDADVRFIIGSNRDLRAEVRAGRFLEDLYYRINVLPVQVPPLDERRDEIPLWAGYFARRHHDKSVPGGAVELSEAGERALLAARWPGNLRQLDNIVRRAYAIALVPHERPPTALLLEESHIVGALAYEARGGTHDLVALLHDAASAFVEEIKRHAGQKPAFDIKHTEALAGFVLGTAVRQMGKERAYRMLGKGKLLLNRNHHRDLKKELEKVEALWEALGAPGEPPFHELLETGDDERG